MSTHKHIDLICVVALIITLVITILFMNGKALGITPFNSQSEDGQFKSEDSDANWNANDATHIVLNGESGKISGSGAYLEDGNLYIACSGYYVISGELSDGSVIVNADKNDKIRLILNGVSVNCEDSPAITVEQAEKVIMTIADGTENSITCGENQNGSEDGAIYSHDDLSINGSGTLNINGAYKHGIVCNDDLIICGGEINITAARDCIHANDSVRISSASLNLSAGDDGITVSNDDSTDYLYVESGSICITDCYEGLEATTVTIVGGDIDITPEDDGINAMSLIEISGGDTRIVNENGRDADGLDSNGDISISGGSLFVSVSESGGSCALDYGSENGGKCTFSGGTIVACGGSLMLEEVDASSPQAFIMNAVSGSANSTVTLKSSEGTTLVSEEIPCSFSVVTISVPELMLGETYTLSVGNNETEITVDNSSVVSSFGGGGMQAPIGMGDKNQTTDVPELPDGEEQDNFGQAPELPNGEQPDGEMPQMPNGGQGPQKPSGEEMPNGAPSDMTDVSPSDMPENQEMQPPENMKPNRQESEMPTIPNGEHEMQQKENDFKSKDDEAENTEAEESINPETTFALIGISAAVLVIGLLVAVKFKQR